MIDYCRCPPNMGPHEFTMSIIDKERDVPAIRQPEFSPDHSRREWVRYERHWLVRIEQKPQAAELLYMLLVAAKRRPEKRAELEGIWRVLLQSVAAQRDGESSTAGTGGQATSHP